MTLFDNLNDPMFPTQAASNAILSAVRAAFTSYFEQSNPDEAKLTFLGSAPLKLLRFGPDRDDVVTYTTLGCSAEPMQNPAAPMVNPSAGPRAELALPVRGGLDAVIRPLGVLCAAPSIEGLVLTGGALIDFGQSLWDKSRFTGFVLTQSDIPPVATEDAEVIIFQPIPATANELALARARGVDELIATWHSHGTDYADLHRSSVV